MLRAPQLYPDRREGVVAKATSYPNLALQYMGYQALLDEFMRRLHRLFALLETHVDGFRFDLG